MIRIIALSLSLLLLCSCSVTRPMVTRPSGPQDLSRYVLVIKKTADGQATHAWTPAKDFDLTAYQSPASIRAEDGIVVRVSLNETECEHQYDICVPQCQSSTRIHQVDKYIYDSSQYGPWRTGKWKYCGIACMRQLANCLGEAGREPVKFEAIDTATDWLDHHQEGLALGTVVVIAGVAFYVAVCSGGIVLLAPVLFFAEVPQ